MRYLVRSGDCIESLAAHFGIAIDDLLALGENARLRSDGRTANILRPGEAIEVPEPPPRTASFSSGGTQRYRVTIPTTKLKIQLFDRQQRQVANRRYEIVIGARVIAAQTDGEGWVEQDIPAIVKRALLRVWMEDGDEHPYEKELGFGAVDPVEEESGLVHRLGNLGFRGADAGGAALALAVARFQRSEDLPVTGITDPATLARLLERHGS